MIEGKGSRVIAESTQLPVSAERVPLDELSVFDGGNFKLWYFPEGMTLKTRSIKLHHEALPVPFPSKRKQILNQKEKEFGQSKGMNLLGGKDFKPRVNIHNIQYEVVDGIPELSFDIRPTTFALASDPEILSDPDLAEHFNYTGAAIALTTTEKDGTSKTVVGKRLPKNKLYPSMGGAAAGGTPHGKFKPMEERSHPDSHERGRMLPADTGLFTQGLLDELEEEINVTKQQLVGGAPIPIALIEDGVQPHLEVGFIGRFNGSTNDLVTQAAESHKTERGEFDFQEEFMVIKGGIQPLRSYLTESNSPMPPTHTGLYTALLIQMMTHEYGDDPERLQSEIEQLQQDMQEHARNNNEKVREFYLANPDKAEAARAKGYKTDAYDFRVGLVDQGLHDPRQWFEEKELLVA